MSSRVRALKPMLVAAGVLLGVPLVVSAQPAGPHIEAGLWESGMEVSGIKMTSQVCMDGSDAINRRAFAPPSRERAAQPDCEKQDVHPIPGGYAVNTTCTSKGHLTHIAGKLTGDFRTHYTMDMTVEQDGRPAQTMHTESRRVGACPAGMKPGEARTQMDQGGMAAAIAA
ncbi:MAG: DUF3617 domain-containing protein, partial [Caulobacteraceae bacterium]